MATAFEVIVIFVFAELAPKTWAVQHPERAALSTAPIIRLLVGFAPLGWITRGLIRVTNALLPGKGSASGPYTSDEMLRAIADEAAEEDVIESDERTLIHSIIDFGDTVVREVMVPRTDMVAVESYARISDVDRHRDPGGFQPDTGLLPGDRRHRRHRASQGPDAGRTRGPPSRRRCRR